MTIQSHFTLIFDPSVVVYEVDVARSTEDDAMSTEYATV